MNFVVLWLMPTPQYLALDESARRSLLLTIAARLQEWSGEQGGFIFSQRVINADGGEAVAAIVSVRTGEFAAAFVDTLKRPDVTENFSVYPVMGPAILFDPNVEGSSMQAMEQILKPFVDLGRGDS